MLSALINLALRCCGLSNLGGLGGQLAPRVPCEDFAWLPTNEVTRAASPHYSLEKGLILEVVSEEFFSKLVYDGLNRRVVRGPNHHYNSGSGCS